MSRAVYPRLFIVKYYAGLFAGVAVEQVLSYNEANDKRAVSDGPWVYR